MPPNGRLITQFGRSAHLGLALLRSTAFRPSAPLKLRNALDADSVSAIISREL